MLMNNRDKTTSKKTNNKSNTNFNDLKKLLLPIYKDKKHNIEVAKSNSNNSFEAVVMSALKLNQSQINLGLFFDKYFFYVKNETKKPPLIELSVDAKKYFVDYFNGKNGGLKENLNRYHQQKITMLLKKFHNKEDFYLQEFTSEWHFVTGMGNQHPLENGLTWHPTLGVPYLPGSSIKGMLRAYLRDYAEYYPELDKNTDLIFGGQDQDAGYSSGAVIFYDAIPTKEVTLTGDIITPHTGDWLNSLNQESFTAENTPADWHDPVPISFLVCKSINLGFYISLRPGTTLCIDIKELGDCLRDALQMMGVGAKTAVGYGQFKETEKCWLKECFSDIKEKISQDNKTPEQKVIDDYKLKLKNTDRVDKGIYSRFIEAISSYPLSYKAQVKEIIEQDLEPRRELNDRSKREVKKRLSSLNR